MVTKKMGALTSWPRYLLSIPAHVREGCGGGHVVDFQINIRFVN